MTRVRVKKINPPKRLRLRLNPHELMRLLVNVTVDRHRGCWLLDGHKNENGYGQVKLHGRAQWAHRVFYAVFVRTLPSGREVNHACHNPSCVCPWHLRRK